MLEFLQEFYFCYRLLPCHFFVRIQRQNCTTDLVEILDEFNRDICLILSIYDTSWHHPFNRNPSRCCF